MNIFLYGNERFSLKIDGKYYGEFSYAKIEDARPCFIEALPHGGSSPVCFYLNYPPISHKNTQIYKLKDGYIIKLLFYKPQISPFKILLQESLLQGKFLLTAFAEGYTKIVLEDSSQAEVAVCPIDKPTLKYKIDGNLLAVYTDGTPSFLVVFSLSPLKIVYQNTVSEFELSNGLKTRCSLPTLERTVAEVAWEFNGSTLHPTTTSFASLCPYSGEEKFVLSKIFFERCLYRIPLADMLDGEIKNNEALLPDFLGNFCFIAPDFATKEGVALGYPSQSIRPTKVFDIQIEKGKICNICEI